MDDDAYLIGTFAPAPECIGFEVPVFSRRDSNITLVQDIDERGKVLGFLKHEFDRISYDIPPQVRATAGKLGLYAFRDPDRLLHVGTQAHLGIELTPKINAGRFNDHPILRFRLSAFFSLTDRVAGDAQAAWGWLEASSSRWAADAWKQEATIVPEVRRCVALCLRDAGAKKADIQRVISSVRLEKAGEDFEITILIPQGNPWSEQFQTLLARSNNLLGNAKIWWPELSYVSVFIREKIKTPFPFSEPDKMESLLKEAVAFLDENIFIPKIVSTSMPKKLVNKARRARFMVSECRKIGDVISYIRKICSKSGGGFEFNFIRSQAAIEDIYKEFSEKFGQYADYCWEITDFELGKKYGGHMLSIFTGTYNVRHGGICPVGKIGEHTAVVIKADMFGGKYNNHWIYHGSRIRYYLKGSSIQNIARKDKNKDTKNLFGDDQITCTSRGCDENLPENRAIIDFPNVPVLVFVKESAGESLYTYCGVFRSVGVETDHNGAAWFDLVKIDRPI